LYNHNYHGIDRLIYVSIIIEEILPFSTIDSTHLFSISDNKGPTTRSLNKKKTFIIFLPHLKKHINVQGVSVLLSLYDTLRVFQVIVVITTGSAEADKIIFLIRTVLVRIRIFYPYSSKKYFPPNIKYLH